jgi:hypothetical protein
VGTYVKIAGATTKCKWKRFTATNRITYNGVEPVENISSYSAKAPALIWFFYWYC